mgnify:CR=1 FL=1
MTASISESDTFSLPIVMNPSIIAAIIKYYADKPKNDTSLALSLYVHLYYTVRRQTNVQVWANDSYLKKGLGVGDTVLKRIKSDLVKMKLIKYIVKRAVNGRITGHYIKVNHVWGRDALERLTGKIDVRMVMMAKRYLLDTIGIGKVICEADDISLPEIWFKGSIVEVEGDLYFDKDELIKLRGHTVSADCDYTFSAEDAPSMIMQVYEIVTK